MGSTAGNTASAQAKLPFQVTLINIGGAWKSASNTVNITVSGTYFVFMDITSCYRPAVGGATADIMLNNQTAFSVQNALQVNTTVGQMRNNAAILKLNVGDKLFVKIPQTPLVCYHSMTNYVTSFSGLLLAF